MVWLGSKLRWLHGEVTKYKGYKSEQQILTNKNFNPLVDNNIRICAQIRDYSTIHDSPSCHPSFFFTFLFSNGLSLWTSSCFNFLIYIRVHEWIIKLYYVNCEQELDTLILARYNSHLINASLSKDLFIHNRVS